MSFLIVVLVGRNFNGESLSGILVEKLFINFEDLFVYYFCL